VGPSSTELDQGKLGEKGTDREQRDEFGEGLVEGNLGKP